MQSYSILPKFFHSKTLYFEKLHNYRSKKYFLFTLVDLSTIFNLLLIKALYFEKYTQQ